MIRIKLAILGGGLALTLFACLCSSCGPYGADTLSVRDDKRYSLFTWESGDAKLCFVLVIRSQRDDFLRRLDPKSAGKCGIAEVKSKLKSLPKGTEVLWEELPRSGFTYPAADTMDEVKNSAQSEGIVVVYAPILG